MRARNQSGGGIGVEDREIVELYWQRAEQALNETSRKYGGYLRRIAWNILQDDADAEECVNDAYLGAWNAIPPKKPTFLGAYLMKIVRNLSLSAYQAARAKKRGGGQVEALSRELADCVTGNPERYVEAAELSRLLDRFLRGLNPKERCIFLRRYWYADAISDIAARYHLSPGTVKSNLHRTRAKLKNCLEEEGIIP